MRTFGAKLIYDEREWRSLTATERAICIVAALLWHEAAAPSLRVKVTGDEIQMDARHLAHKSGAAGRVIGNLRLRLFLLFPVLNGQDLLGYRSDIPALTVRRGASIDEENALADWRPAGAIGTVRTHLEIKV